MSENNTGLNGYVCFYNGQRVEVYAETSLKARSEAARRLRVRPRSEYKINVILALRADGTEVVHTADF